MVNEGMKFYQEKGMPAQRIKKSDVINTPENVEHWHEPASVSQVPHIAITNFQGDINVVGLKPV